MTRAFHDPYDSMSDREFHEYVGKLFDRAAERTVPVSIRWPEQLLARVKKVADAAGVPYQTLIKDLVSAALPVAERRQAAPRKVATARKTTTAKPRSKRASG
jgi:predicted DNA binding CopG/RHH family protein